MNDTSREIPVRFFVLLFCLSLLFSLVSGAAATPVAAAPDGKGTGRASQAPVPRPFVLKSLSYTREGSMTKYVGEVANFSGHDFDMLFLRLMIHTKAGELLEAIPIAIKAFPGGTAKRFEAFGYKRPPDGFKYYVTYWVSF